MGKCILAYPNRVDSALLSGGNWARPLANLQTRKLSQFARSANLLEASTRFDLALDRTRVVKIVGFVNHNLSVTATYRIRGYLDAGHAQLAYDSGMCDVWPRLYQSHMLDWSAPNFWDGRPTVEDLAGLKWTRPHVLKDQVAARYWKIEFFDAENAAGYVQMGRLFIASGWQPALNMSYGASIGAEDPTIVDTAYSGAEYFDVRTPYRVARFALDWMSVDEGMSRALDMQLKQGVHGEVLYMYDVDDTVHQLRRSFLGRLRQLSPIEQPYYDTNRTPFEIKELQ